jgi:hypothetical protein
MLWNLWTHREPAGIFIAHERKSAEKLWGINGHTWTPEICLPTNGNRLENCWASVDTPGLLRFVCPRTEIGWKFVGNQWTQLDSWDLFAHERKSAGNVLGISGHTWTPGICLPTDGNRLENCWESVDTPGLLGFVCPRTEIGGKCVGHQWTHLDSWDLFAHERKSAGKL